MKDDFLDNLGRVVSGAAEVIGKKTEEVAEAVGKKTGEVVEVTKLKNQIYSLERDINRAYTELGKAVYAQYLEKNSAEEAYLAICEEIAQKEILIDQYTGEIENLKKERPE